MHYVNTVDGQGLLHYELLAEKVILSLINMYNCIH